MGINQGENLKVLFIGGTGLISSACSDLALERGHELFILNRSQSGKYPLPAGAQFLRADVHGRLEDLKQTLGNLQFDSVVDWIAYTPDDVERDIRLFSGKTRQFVFISSASAYQKPPANYLITEKTPLENPYWKYSRDKIACENRLMEECRKNRFPVTIIRPSLTYGPSQIPLIVGSWQHPYTVVDRIKKGKKLIVPGDGTSLWVLTWNADFARGLLGLLGNDKSIGESFHITTDEVLTWNQIYTELFNALGVESNIVHIPSDLIAAYWPHATEGLIGDKANSAVFENSKIKKFVPDFHCDVPWAEGVRRAIAWHEADQSRMSIDTEANDLWDRIISAYQRAFPE
jgi:nucleoside-diphosphate-sugar epimerase